MRRFELDVLVAVDAEDEDAARVLLDEIVSACLFPHEMAKADDPLRPGIDGWSILDDVEEVPHG